MVCLSISITARRREKRLRCSVLFCLAVHNLFYVTNRHIQRERASTSLQRETRDRDRDKQRERQRGRRERQRGQRRERMILRGRMSTHSLHTHASSKVEEFASPAISLFLALVSAHKTNETNLSLSSLSPGMDRCVSLAGLRPRLSLCRC